MKLPFINKLSGLSGVFSRLNPAALIAKIKAKKSGAEDDDDELISDEDADLFGDLGNLDELDAEAAENADEDASSEDELADFDEDAFDDDDHEPDVLDEVDGDDQSFADLDAEEAAGGALTPPPMPGGDGDLVSEIMDDLENFDIGEAFEDADDDEADEEAQKAKLKKLIMLAGGGVAAAVVFGGVAWWLLGGDEGGSSEEEMAAASSSGRPGDLVIALDDVPPFADDTPIASSQSEPAAQATMEQPSTGLAPPSGDVDAGAPSLPDTPVVENSGGGTELQRHGLDVQMEPGVGVVIPAGTKASFPACRHCPQWMLYPSHRSRRWLSKASMACYPGLDKMA